MQHFTKYKYIILGAGPSGLTFANKLLQNGETSFLILEKENEAGGLCRSAIVDNAPVDIGGGHFLDVRRKEVLDFLFLFMPRSEWQSYKRKSTILVNGTEIDYPLEANIWQFPVEEQVEYLLSISKTASGKKRMPKKFVDWIYWKLGDKIADEYMIPYNEKIWSMDLNELGTYWLYKLPEVSLRETLQSCLTRTPAGKMPAHAEFLYPKKYGYGEVWKRMADAVKNHLRYNFTIHSIDVASRKVNDTYAADIIINTIPWKEFKKSNIPGSITTMIDKLVHSSIRVGYHKENFNSDAHWTYVPDRKLPHHRVLNRKNFSSGSSGYLTETNEKRASMQREPALWEHLNKYAYPINTLRKPVEIRKILTFFEKKKIYGLGRWGEWEHMNSDVAVERAIALFNRIHS